MQPLPSPVLTTQPLWGTLSELTDRNTQVHTRMYTLIHIDTHTQLCYGFSTKKDCTTHISLEPVFFHFMISCEFLSRSIYKDLLYSSYFKIKLAVSWPHRALCSVCSVVYTVTRHSSFHVLVYFPEYLSHFITTHLEPLVPAIASWSIACVPWLVGEALLILCACDAFLSVLPPLGPLHSDTCIAGPASGLHFFTV